MYLLIWTIFGDNLLCSKSYVFMRITFATVLLKVIRRRNAISNRRPLKGLDISMQPIVKTIYLMVNTHCGRKTLFCCRSICTPERSVPEFPRYVEGVLVSGGGWRPSLHVPIDIGVAAPRVRASRCHALDARSQEPFTGSTGG